ncbi:MAG: hypothetical protein Fur0041_17430 [Bacteroidia bacterium]
MKKGILILALLLSQIAVFAGDPREKVMFVSGTVTDMNTSETLSGVEVRVKGTNIVTYTDFDGKFYLNDLPAGTYQLEFRYITYSASSVVTDDEDHNAELEISLNNKN